MAELTIPDEYVRGIEVVKSLSESDVAIIVKLMQDAGRLPGGSESIVRLLRPNLPNLSESDVEEFAKTLHSLYLFLSHSDVSVSRFVSDLCEAIIENEKLGPPPPTLADVAALNAKFTSLLTVPSLSIISKAHGLRYDSLNLFWDAKVISDIRPIWNGDVKNPPEGTVITHTLKLEYHDTRGHGEIYLAIDGDDIEKLISVLERAKNKSATLKSLASTGGWLKILDE